MLKQFFNTIKDFFATNVCTNDNTEQDIIGFMSLTEYNVRGTNSATNRRKGLTVYSTDEDSAISIAKSQGLVAPFEVSSPELCAPTEKQIAYAKDLGIKLPKGCCMQDVSALLSNHQNEDIRRPTTKIINFAVSRGLYFSTLLNEKSLYNFIFNHFDIEDKIAFFCFSIYQYCNKDHSKTLDTTANKALFYKFASENLSNEKFITSMQKYEGKDLLVFGEYEDNGWLKSGGSKNTIAYKTAHKFLKQHNLLKTK